DQAFVLRPVLVHRPELVPTRPERRTGGVFECGDRRFRLDTGIDQIFGQSADDAVAAGVDLTDLVRMLASSLQHATRRGVDHRADAARLCVERILESHDNPRERWQPRSAPPEVRPALVCAWQCRFASPLLRPPPAPLLCLWQLCGSPPTDPSSTR